MRPDDRQRFESILRKRAERLKVDPERLTELEDSDEPRFLRAARARAAHQRTTYEDVLRQDLERLRASRYPGLECLEPDEVERFAAGVGLSEDRLQHVGGCDACKDLLQALSPSPDRIEE